MSFPQLRSPRIQNPLATPQSGGGSTGSIKAFVGGTFVAKPVKVWNGSSWVVKPLKQWNGSSWLLTNY